MILNILTVPNPILTAKAQPIQKINRTILTLVSDMIETCRAASGIGLAAPQIGKSIRLCVINLEHLGIPPFALVNPKIVKKSWKKTELEEGCLSIPGIYGIVKRAEKIKLKALSLQGQENELSADGLLARVIQHEIDHLDGILITSKIIKYTDGTETKERKTLRE
ncbi:MAG: peptide deformylase [Candidatus Doudnabacteria bacterium]|nr:peptide deformylase [Candidatus Doudnabacteria bacterium]